MLSLLELAGNSCCLSTAAGAAAAAAATLGGGGVAAAGPHNNTNNNNPTLGGVVGGGSASVGAAVQAAQALLLLAAEGIGSGEAEDKEFRVFVVNRLANLLKEKSAKLPDVLVQARTLRNWGSVCLSVGSLGEMARSACSHLRVYVRVGGGVDSGRVWLPLLDARLLALADRRASPRVLSEAEVKGCASSCPCCGGKSEGEGRLLQLFFFCSCQQSCRTKSWIVWALIKRAATAAAASASPVADGNLLFFLQTQQRQLGVSTDLQERCFRGALLLQLLPPNLLGCVSLPVPRESRIALLKTSLQSHRPNAAESLARRASSGCADVFRKVFPVDAATEDVDSEKARNIGKVRAASSATAQLEKANLRESRQG